ncbi:hypothetical protein DFR86_10695 [Acidianus sulfidivorans JP7]|uniref:Uncharacterized protein n=1 Tax=Acidianus sulfidivorans JP7 TaxID=619593 RepID=A0A2U9IPQ2_9CREN|nr:hypothetical protein [Acidianus sulfidivorans]AWR97956.1 hypothetical protein DFR86_10695 [Acidianus sulfidivorans JP7]
MHKLLKIGLIVLIIGAVLYFIVSPVMVGIYAGGIGNEIATNGKTISLEPGRNITINYNGKDNNSMFILVYNTSTHLPLLVKGVSSTHPAILDNDTYVYYIQPSIGNVEIINNQTSIQKVYYSFGYESLLNITLIDIEGILSLILLIGGIGLSIVGFILGRKKKPQQ